MKARVLRAVLSAAAVCGIMNAAAPASAADLSTCATVQEAAAFSLRHLQSRLMVAALSCNQRDAYNNFVETFRPPLADAGAGLISYFQRSGGGQTALNRHITELANVAGLYRASDPEGFCRETWNMFLLLEDEPNKLESQAVAQVMKEAGAPTPCVLPTAPPTEITVEAAGDVKAATEAPASTVD